MYRKRERERERMENKKKREEKQREVKTINRFEKVTHQILYNVYRAHALLAVRIETRPTQSDAVLLIKMCTRRSTLKIFKIVRGYRLSIRSTTRYFLW